MSSTRLVLVRHGHVDPHGVMCGWTDVPLTERGEQQAARVGRRERDVDVVYASPLRRARETARQVSEAIRYVPALREIGCGRVDGSPFAEIQRDHPALWAANDAQLDDDFRWPGGESYRELRDRSVGAISSIAAQHEGRRVAVVTHAGVITQIVGYLLDVPAARWSLFRVGNASTTEIDWQADRGVVRSFNDREHLEPALRT